MPANATVPGGGAPLLVLKLRLVLCAHELRQRVADTVERGGEGLSSRQQGADGDVVGREGRAGGGGAAWGAEEGVDRTEQTGEAVLEPLAAPAAVSAAVHGAVLVGREEQRN
jgi:hypothetical protein